MTKDFHAKTASAKESNASEGVVKAASVFKSRRNTHLDTNVNAPSHSAETTEFDINMDINDVDPPSTSHPVVLDTIIATRNEETPEDAVTTRNEPCAASPQRGGDQNIFDIVGSYSPPERFLEYVDTDKHTKSIKV